MGLGPFFACSHYIKGKIRKITEGFVGSGLEVWISHGGICINRKVN